MIKFKPSLFIFPILVSLVLVGVISCRSAPIIPPNPLPEGIPTTSAKIVWDFDLGDGNQENELIPIVVGDFLYTASNRGNVAKIDKNGKNVWVVNADEEISAGVGADYYAIVFATKSGKIIALNSDDGKLLWKNSLASESVGPPLVLGDTVISRTTDGLFFGWNKNTGARKWLIARPVDSLSIRSYQQMVGIRDAVIATSAKASVFAFFAENGKIIWEQQISRPTGNSLVERIQDITSRPDINDKVVCAVAFQGKVACLDLLNGQPLWQGGEGSSAGLVIASERVVEIANNDKIIALNFADSKKLWENSQLFNRFLTTPIYHNGQIVFSDGLGFVHWLNPNNGTLSAYLALPGALSNTTSIKKNPRLIKTPPIVFDDMIIIQNQKGKIFAIK